MSMYNNISPSELASDRVYISSFSSCSKKFKRADVNVLLAKYGLNDLLKGFNKEECCEYLTRFVFNIPS